MPAAVWVPAVAGIVGSGMMYAGQRSAQNQQRRAMEQATALQREREAEAKRRYDQQWAEYQRQSAAYEQRRRELLRSRGYNIPEPTSGPGTNRFAMPGGGGTTLGSLMGSNPPPGATDVGGIPVPGPGSGLRDARAGILTPSGPIVTQDVQPPLVDPGQGMSLADLSGWSDWRRRAM